ncbi:MAG: AMP-binding protein, partial [Tabrizicola sp.]|nr:AMP-binding protein [Tabrizicola sp.]
MTATVSALLADKDAGSNAIGAPGRMWLSYGALRALAAEVEADLRRFGIGAADRVAIVLPNGPEMAAAFVAIAQAAVTAPLNPAYQETEFSFYLQDLRAKA